MLKVIDEQKQKKVRVGCLLAIIIPLLVISTLMAFVYLRYSKQIVEAYRLLFPQQSTVSTASLTSFNLKGSIYYVKNRDIFKVSGSTITQVTHLGFIDEASISQDGLYAVYTKLNANYSDLYLLNLKTLSSTLLTKGSNSSYMYNDLWNTDASISPNDSSIAYISDKSKFTTSTSDLSVYQMNLSTKAAAQVTQGYAYTGGDQDPTYYPLDPNYILYSKYIYEDGQQQPLSELYLMNVKLKKSYPLTAGGDSVLEATFSPDGTYIAFIERETVDEETDKYTNLYIMPFSLANLTSSNPTVAFAASYASKVLLHTGLDSMPTFSPDGSQIAFLSPTTDKMIIETLGLAFTTDKQGQVVITPGKLQPISQNDSVSTISHISWTQ